MIIAVVNEKGGSGKTTLAINLAIKLKDCKDKVLFIDSDPQKSGEIFTKIRESENLAPAFTYKSERENLLNIVKQNIKSFDSIVIDTGGRDSKESRIALSIADIILIPTYPSQYDLAVLNNMINLYVDSKNIESKCFVVISRAFTNVALQHKISEFQNIVRQKCKQNIELMDSILYDREAIRMATTQGLGISESQNNKAKDEFNNFFTELLNRYKNN
ncbi:AAA family ATPase [Helicobacter saguini]|uniref:AAA family ATPase n=1 Tax=Helicobacter saguini TaxID=1548018 RepID=A0A099BAL8_9HELI|nr:AAA family ATPase [Helicobacter saguini]MWV63014.1 AAA family ATPase [Helicobacter saguini]MWV66317.1 AAA family ATPase [Helicobacter saguini]MWV68669.1 AAA family ATPase [Helicobacter saguini]MWV71780.1 AAA family ATPase [Helicobacter saguini]TLD95809.1 chromosome partitioning protein ParA [Helicobacter saguini]